MLLRRESKISESDGIYTFHQSHSSGRTVEIELSYLDNRVLAQMFDVEIPEEIAVELRKLNRSDAAQMSQRAREAINPPLSEISSSVHDLLGLVKYHLRHFDLKEVSASVKSRQWGNDPEDMRDIPVSFSFSVEGYSNLPLDRRTHPAIQAALNTGNVPLIAMRHLHHAKQESRPHHKWIDATIAAELAVKEVFCRAHPEIEALLMEMPAPPLSKLYGSLLERYLGEKSPFRNKLIKGQEKRNLLVHRPGAPTIDPQEANDYVAVVEGAIFHLLSLLYPDDELIRQARHLTRHSQH